MTPILPPAQLPDDARDGHVTSDAAVALDHFVSATSTRLHELASRMPVDEAVEEMRAHLEDAMNDLQMRGLHPDQSMHEALRRFGPLEDVTRAFADLARERPGQRRIRGSKRHAVLATLAAAATIAALGSSAVASAHTSPSTASHPTPHGRLTTPTHP